MRITFLSPPPNLSGGERVIAIYAKHLQSAGHNVEILCTRRDRPSLKRKLLFWKRTKSAYPMPEGASHYEQYGVPFRFVKHYGPMTTHDLPSADVTIATFWPTAKTLAESPVQVGKKLYLIQSDESNIYQGSGAEKTYSLPLTHIYVSKWIADRIKARHPLAIGKVIRNGTEIEPFDKGPRSKPEKFRVGTVWGGDTIKGGDIAVRSVELARERGVQIELVGFGTSEPESKYRDQFDNYHFFPTKDEIAGVYSSCTLWLFTSRFEGFGLPVLEAMAARTPVVGTDTGAARELISADCGTVVRVDDVLGIVAEIERFARMPAVQWQEISYCAWRTARMCTWDASVKEFEEFISSTP